MSVHQYTFDRAPNEPDAEWIVRLRGALDTIKIELLGSTMMNHFILGELSRVNHLYETQQMENWGAAHTSSPFIRQHNEISKMVADLLKEPPGPGKALVRFLAATLDMELPEQWRESQN